MRTTILAVALTCCSVPALANQCNVEFSGNMQLENNVLAVTLDNNTQLTIAEDKTLYVDGVALTLDTQQQLWVDNYYDGISQAAPQAAAIATEAVALASTALNEVFTELLGTDNTALADLSDKLQDLDQQIQYNFYSENGDIRLHSESFENGEFFGHQWEAQFEDAIESLVTESIGHIMVAIGTQLIFNGGDMDRFEQKMERFGEQMEQKIEYQAEALEEQAEQLCTTLAKVDTAENQLQMHIKQLSGLDVIQVSHDYKAM
ncbi:YggN family protein [Paraglaciecola arctica]|uniref:YggN family protein n=1 Tax=Paraglaciecola arctica TaxID=1128911 RepID=UPI001C0737F8|nr:YggN family protein [Paraglaciecola arctica]MBU3005124.1 YggN family protein [Paraglaciecola arctica]